MVMVVVVVVVVRRAVGGCFRKIGVKGVFSGGIVSAGGKLGAVFLDGIFRKRGGRQSVRFGKFFPVKKS